nr:phospholipase-like protein [Tanacetum cinerariifolium]
MGGMGSMSMGSGSKGLGFRLVFPNEHVFLQWFMMQRLVLDTTLHDNHLLNFLLQHQRYVEDPTIDIPFIFDIDRRTLELGRQDFCLITGFRFGKISLDPKEKYRSQFRECVFSETPNSNGPLLLDLVNNDVEFNNLDDDDVVHVYLLLALDYVFMGQEIKHLLLKAIVNLADNLSEWDKFPWGEYMWREFHKRVYNVVAKHREYHLKMLGTNPRYVANYALYGFVFPLKLQGVVVVPVVFILVFRKRFVMRYMFVPRFIAFVGKEVCTKSVDKDDVPEIVVLEKNVKEQQMQNVICKDVYFHLRILQKRLNNRPSKVNHNVDNNVDHIVGDRVVLDKIFKEQQLQILDMQRRLLSLEHITKTQTNGLSEPDHNVDHLDKVTGMEALVFKLVVLTTSQWKGPAINWNDVSENHPVDGLNHQSMEGVSQVTSVNKVTELINELFTSPNDPGFSLVNFVFGYVDVDNMDKDGCITDVKTMARPFL